MCFRTLNNNNRVPACFLVLVTLAGSLLSSGCVFFNTTDFKSVRRFPHPDMEPPKHKPKVRIKCFTPGEGNAHHGAGHCQVKAGREMERSDQFRVVEDDSKDFDFRVQIVVHKVSGGAVTAWNWFSSILCILTATVLPAYGWETYALEIRILDRAGKRVFQYKSKFKVNVVTWLFLAFVMSKYDMHHPWEGIFRQSGRIATKKLWELLKSGRVPRPMIKEPEKNEAEEAEKAEEAEAKEAKEEKPASDVK